MKQSVFSKESQKELRERYMNGQIEVWRGDEKMVKFCTKEAAYIIPICGGKYLLSIDKEKIDTEFWFGESDCGQGLSHDENAKRMSDVRHNIEDYFIEHNLRSINSMIETLEEILSTSTSKKIEHHLAYYSSPEDNCIHNYSFYDPYSWNGNTKPSEGGEDMTKKDISLLLDAYKIYKEDFIKRLHTYLLKFGTKKLYIHSYWIDR